LPSLDGSELILVGRNDQNIVLKFIDLENKNRLLQRLENLNNVVRMDQKLDYLLDAGFLNRCSDLNNQFNKSG